MSAWRHRLADRALAYLARSQRWGLGWYWTPEQKAVLVQAEDVAWTAWEQHGGRKRHSR